MSNHLLKGKRGIIFGALNNQSIAWKVAQRAHEEGATFVLTNAPIAIPGMYKANLTICTCCRNFHFRVSFPPNAIFSLVVELLDIIKDFSLRTVDLNAAAH